MLAERTARRQERFDSIEEVASKYQGRAPFERFEDGADEELAASIVRQDGDGWMLIYPPEAESSFYGDQLRR